MLKWLARLASLGVMAAFCLLLVAVAINEDPVEPAGMPIAILMALAVAACAAAWRWERAGGVLLIVTAGALAVAALSAASAFRLGPDGYLVSALYGVPVLIAGGLFLASGVMGRHSQGK